MKLNQKFIAALFFFLLTLLSVAAGISDFGITWDEPEGYFRGSIKVVEWFEEIGDHLKKGNWKVLFDNELKQKYWPPSTEDSQNQVLFNNHPPIARYLPALSWYIFHDFFGDIFSLRLSSAFLFSLVVSSLFWVMSSEFGFAAGAFSAISLITMPRVFGHAHVAATDIPMMAFWWFCILSFYKALNNEKWKYVFALILGLAWVVKFTGLLIPVGLILYAITSKDKRIKNLIKPALLISPLVMWVFNPTLWGDPLGIFYESFIKGSLFRGNFVPVPVYYLGETYSFDLPWHHSLVLTAVTTPVATFILSIFGILISAKNLTQTKLTSLFLWQLIWYYFVMTLPFTPNHDGVRLFLPIFPFIACFAGVGFKKLCFWFHEKIKRQGFKYITYPFIKMSLGVVLMFPCSFNLIATHPYYLEWFNALAGGVSGAHRLGFETTFWLDSVSKEVRKDLNLLPNNSNINVYPNLYNYFRYLQTIGLLKKELNFKEGPANFIILIPRQGMFNDWAWDLYLKSKPVYQSTLDGVPLFLMYQVGAKNKN